MSFFRPVTYLKTLLLLAGSIASLRSSPPPDPPAGWVQPEGPPNYRHRVLADLKIERQLSPGSYLARVQIRGREMKWRRQWFSAGDFGAEIEPFLVYLTLRGPVLHDGCTVHAFVTGRAVPRALSGGFGEYVRRLGASSTLFLSPKYHIQSVECGDPSLRDFIRLWIEASIARRIPDKTAADAAAGFVLGSAGYMDRSFKRRAAELGILHVFAASGMHLAILYGLLFLPAAWLLGRRHPIAVLIPLPACIFYVWLLAFPVSLSRALVFVSLAAASCLFHRRLSVLQLLLNSALILLWWMPSEFLTLSSALSFGAVAGIMLCTPVLLRLYAVRNKAVRFVWSQVLVTVSASICTTPLLVWAFGGHAYMSVVVNLLAIPLSDLVLPLLFGSLALEALLPQAAAPFWHACGQIISLFCDATVAASKGSAYAAVSPYSLPVICSAAMAAMILYCAICAARRTEVCGRALSFLRRAVVVLVCLSGPPGGALAYFAPRIPCVAAVLAQVAGRPDSRFAEQAVDSNLAEHARNSDEVKDRGDSSVHRSSTPAQPGPELPD